MAQSRRKGRPGAALLVSLAVHLVVLVLLARAIPILPAIAPTQDVQVDLVPTVPQSRFATPVSRAAASQAAATQAAPALADVTAPVRRGAAHPRAAEPRPTPPVRRALSQPAPRPVPAAPRQPPAPPAPPAQSRAGRPNTGAAPSASTHGPAPSPSAALPGDEPAGGVKKFLRETVGCSHQDFAHLTVAERFECERQNGVQAAIGAKQKLDALPANKRAYYDAVRDAYEAARNPYTPMDTEAGGKGASSSMGGHGLNYSCVHGKCGLNLPQGAGTEESGVGVPPQ